ncbi:uncharacterized protein LOC126947616 [Macaca thibetana thibetana]|uniref:uncharacterized protein LOC126947616 n=1 Tax=Macaca thibetana thibetana TaxID=257877 RepID=UPI0021BCBCA3|nr:uncharacterized protein LOC126947616 [Macaca thibetana thibetana]
MLEFAEIAKPLYTVTGGNDPLVWTDTEEQAFKNLKKALTEAPALALPNISKPFHLFIHESQGVAKAELTQTLGPWRCPVAYLFGRDWTLWPLDGQAVCKLQATASLVQEADKLTLDQNLTLTAPHAIETLLQSASGKRMSNARILQYQSLLLDQPDLTFSPTRWLNPATLLPDPDFTTPVHDCQQLLETTETGRPDLQDVPLNKADATVFTDGNSFLKQGVQKAGAAVTTETDVLWAQALPASTSAQKAELITLTQALQWGKDKHINIYTDSRYAFATVHVHGASAQECGLLTSAGKTIKKQEILALLEAVWLPQQVAVIHCKGHQRENTAVAHSNRRADCGREAGRLPVVPLVLLPTVSFPQPNLPNHPKYSTKEEKQASHLQANKN